MMKLLHLVFALYFFCSNWIVAQPSVTNFPQDYFRSPVDIPILLSGTFGELRSNHFHSGLDIKTNGQQGLKVYAIADGEVSRIRVSPYGYGYAIYIDHPNGYTSVYGHLQKFNSHIAAFVRQSQHAIESYEVDLYPEKGRFIIKKGEVIAYSGNSGGSSGPHLHFEIRKTSSEIPVNPMLFGFQIKDDIAPVIEKISLHTPADWKGNMGTGTWPVKKSGAVYKMSGADTLTTQSAIIGIGVSAYDQLTGASNKNGVYKITLLAAGETVFQSTFDSIGFHESRYINALIDYREYIKSKTRFMACFRKPGNHLGIYNHLTREGYIQLKDSKPVKLDLIIEDFEGNKARSVFYVKKIATAPQDIITNPAIVFPGQPFDFNRDNIKVTWDDKALYDTLNLEYKKGSKNHPKGYSPIYSIHKNEVALHTAMQISIRADSLPARYYSKAIIARVSVSGNLISEGGQFENGNVTASSRYFGDFIVALDTIGPKIEPQNISKGKNMVAEKTIKCKISDNLSGIKSYRPTIDNKWVLMEYDSKSRMLTYFFENIPDGKEHIFELVVTDEKSNLTTIKLNFIR